MKNTENNPQISIARITLKVFVVLLVINFAWILLSSEVIGNISVYNWLIKGRERLPYGENPEVSYNISLFNLEAMFSSHKIDSKAESSDLKVVLIGDSSIWGFLHKPEETLAGLLVENFKDMDVQLLNLGYPSISVLKDLQIIDKASEYEPDLILWFTTLEALPIEKQIETPINKNNLENINYLIKKYDLHTIQPQQTNILSRTFLKQRRHIADIISLQLYGFLWNATGIDQEYPESYNKAQRDFHDFDGIYRGLTIEDDLAETLALEIISKAINTNQEVDFILVNEPTLISHGENSEVQYNFYYPKWAYDNYRFTIADYAEKNDITYYDFWNLVPENEFTNSAIHLSETGEKIFAEEISKIIVEYIEEKNLNVR